MCPAIDKEGGKPFDPYPKLTLLVYSMLSTMAFGKTWVLLSAGIWHYLVVMFLRRIRNGPTRSHGVNGGSSDLYNSFVFVLWDGTWGSRYVWGSRGLIHIFHDPFIWNDTVNVLSKIHMKFRTNYLWNSLWNFIRNFVCFFIWGTVDSVSIWILGMDHFIFYVFVHSLVLGHGLLKNNPC